MMFKAAFFLLFLTTAMACNYRANYSLNTLKKCYLIIRYFRANFIQATNFCNYLGMELATVESKQEDLELLNLLERHGCSGETVWVSGSDLAKEGKFVWMSNGKLMEYTNFAKDEGCDNPNEDCVEVSSKTRKWNDANCKKQQFFVCQTNKDCPNCTK